MLCPHPSPARARPPRARRCPPRGRQAGPSVRVLSLTGPARAAGAHGSPRELGPPGLQVSARPCQAAQAAEPRSSGPAAAARSSSRRCPLGTDQQQDGGQPRGRGPGVIATRAAKNPPPAGAVSNEQPLRPAPGECFPLTGQSACQSEPASRGRSPTLGHVTVTARGRMRAVPGVVGGRAFAGDSEAVAPLASLRPRLRCGPGRVLLRARRTPRPCLLRAV